MNRLNHKTIRLDSSDYTELCEKFISVILNGEKVTITYFNAHCFNLHYKSSLDVYKDFDIIHPDGTGIFLTLKYLYREKCFTKRINGSDLYPFLEQQIIKNNWKVAFWGDTESTVSKLKMQKIIAPNLLCISGFDYSRDDAIKRINVFSPQILIIGLGVPEQEILIQNIKNQINSNILMAVGDGIKVFAGNKVRGPVILRKLGFEWFVRILYDPRRYLKRYLIGIPQFIYRVLKSYISDQKIFTGEGK